MTKEDEAEVQRLLKNVDVTELMDMLKKHGNRYSRRILKFFRWFCKYVPIIIMFFHAYGIWEFSQHPREMLKSVEDYKFDVGFIHGHIDKGVVSIDLPDGIATAIIFGSKRSINFTEEDFVELKDLIIG